TRPSRSNRITKWHGPPAGPLILSWGEREAIGDLEQALKLKPDDSEADKLLAQARAVEALARKPATSPVTPQPPPAEPAPEVVIAAPVLNSPAPPEPPKHDSASAALHNQRGRELTKLGRYREAIIELSAAIEADPTFALAYNARGFAYHMVRDYSSAVADFDKAIELMPGYKTPSITAPPPGRRAGVKER
ncbi:MAG TPA: tetratricopeptide repeat protein, partial [Bryobacteraceae bacterium]|nr:tetratricopeptide repeat protein [Bryobacteraceae bacterium]